MNLKKLLGATLVMAATVAGLVGCGPKTVQYQQGIGSVISFAETNGELTQINVTAVSALFDADGKVVSAYIDEVQIPVVAKDGAVAYNPTSKQVKDAGSKNVESKKELKERYGMEDFRGACKEDPKTVAAGCAGEWFEQIALVEDYYVGKTVSEVAGDKYFKRDDQHTVVPAEGNELFGTVTMTLGSYTAALEEAYANRKAAVEVGAKEEVKAGLGIQVGAAGNTINVTMGALSIGADNKVVGAQMDVFQVPVTVEGEAVVVNRTAKQVKDAGAKVVESKLELKERYAMEDFRGVCKEDPKAVAAGCAGEWFEQALLIEDFFVGKTVADAAAQPTFKRDDNHTNVPADGHELFGTVTMTIQDYNYVFVEANTNKK